MHIFIINILIIHVLNLQKYTEAQKFLKHTHTTLSIHVI